MTSQAHNGVGASAGAFALFASRRSIILPALFVLTAACGNGSDDASSASPASARDSGTVRIVENTGPRWKAGDEWALDTLKPTFDVGTTDGDPMSQLHQVRAAYRLSDGRVAVANMGDNTIRFFDAAGKFVKTVGRTGQGPGEFEQLWRMRKIGGDSLMALEPADLTSIFTSDGRYIRRFRLDPAKGYTNLWWLGRFENGTMLVFSLARLGTRELQPSGRVLGPNEEEDVLSVPEKPVGYRDSLMHFLYTMDGHRIGDTIARLPSQWVGSDIAFAPNAAYAVAGNRFYHSPGDRVEIREFTVAPDAATRVTGKPVGEPLAPPAVALTRIIRVPDGRDLTVTRADSVNYVKGQRELMGRMMDVARSRGQTVDTSVDALLARMRMVFAPKMPAHTNRMFVDPAHAIWVQTFNSDEQAPTRWMIIDSAGVYLGTLTMPARFVPHDIGADYVLGVWKDALDVEHVRMYGLRRGKQRSP
jgi:hypothetical protein